MRVSSIHCHQWMFSHGSVDVHAALSDRLYLRLKMISIKSDETSVQVDSAKSRSSPNARTSVPL